MEKAVIPSMTIDMKNEMQAWLDSDQDFNTGRQLLYKITSLIYPGNNKYYRFYELLGKVGPNKHYRDVLVYEMEQLMNNEEKIKSRTVSH